MQNLPRVSMALLLLYGGYLVIHGGITLGTFLAFNSYVVMLQAPFMMIGFLMMMAQRSAASAQRVLEVLDAQPEIVDRPGSFDLINCDGDVRFRDLDFAYGGSVSVLRDFSLHLRPGETVALVGRTGCGKSTVARLIPRFYDVSAGALEVDGVHLGVIGVPRGLLVNEDGPLVPRVPQRPNRFHPFLGHLVALAVQHQLVVAVLLRCAARLELPVTTFSPTRPSVRWSSVVIVLAAMNGW